MSEAPRWIGGIDEPLPAGEDILWSGSPVTSAVARHVAHRRGWVVYIGVMAALLLWSAAGTVSAGDVLKLLVVPVLVLVATLGMVQLFARATAKSSNYIITSRRVVLRVGIAFPIAINIPLRLIDNVGLRTFSDGSGELQLELSPSVKLAYIALWPHVETLRYLAAPRPKLRGLADPHAVGAVLQRALAADAQRNEQAYVVGESETSRGRAEGDLIGTTGAGVLAS